MSYNSKVHFTDSTELTVASGGELIVESGGAFNIESGGGLDIESGGDLDIESGGHIDIASGGYLAYPVVGCTSSYISGSGTSEAAALPNNGIVFALINGTSSRRHCDIAAPTAGAKLTIVVSKDAASSSGGIVFHSSAATFDSTNAMMRWVSSGSTYVTSQDDYGVLELIGHSSAYWAILRKQPSTGWVACAST